MRGNNWAHEVLSHYLIAVFIKIDNTNFKQQITSSSVDTERVCGKISDSGNNVEVAIFEYIKIITSVYYIIVNISSELCLHVILEDCGWGSCLEVVGGAASC